MYYCGFLSSVFFPPFQFVGWFLKTPWMQQTSAAIQMAAIAPQSLLERPQTVPLHQLYLDLEAASLLVLLLFDLLDNAMTSLTVLFAQAAFINLHVTTNIVKKRCAALPKLREHTAKGRMKQDAQHAFWNAGRQILKYQSLLSRFSIISDKM